jgi:hypothetical protein
MTILGPRRVVVRVPKSKTPSLPIVGDTWLHRHDSVPNAITSTSFRAPPFTPVEIYYDPAGATGATERPTGNELNQISD